MKEKGLRDWRNWVGSRSLLFLVAFLFFACEKEEGFQPDVINPPDTRSSLNISVRHFYFNSFSVLVDTAVANAKVELYPDMLSFLSSGSSLERFTDGTGIARFGKIDAGNWIVVTSSNYLGTDLDSVMVSESGALQYYEVWYP